MASTVASTTVDYEAIKARQRGMWQSGDYAAIATRIQYMSELLCEELDLSAGERVLDIATGTGNAALAAARRAAAVTAIDYAPALLERGRQRAGVEGLDIDFIEADVEALPFDDQSFDTVLSVVGVMFAPDQTRAAFELRRVCRSGGRISVANWTPDGFIGELLRLVASFVPPPPGLQSPLRWGTRTGVEELLGEVQDLTFQDRNHLFRFYDPRDFAGFFVAWYGPTERAYHSLDAPRRVEFVTAIENLASSWNTATDGTLRVPGAYLESLARVP